MANQKKHNLKLEECFHKILNGQQIEMNYDEAKKLLSNLEVNMKGLKPKIYNILPFLMIYFIKTWPGWQKSKAYINKEITYQEWFQKFKDYISFKLNIIILGEIDKVCEDIQYLSIDNSILFGIDNQTQTDFKEKAVAPYSLQIQAPARFLNSMVFVEGLNSNISAKPSFHLST